MDTSAFFIFLFSDHPLVIFRLFPFRFPPPFLGLDSSETAMKLE